MSAATTVCVSLLATFCQHDIARVTFDQERFYLSSEEYHAFAMQQIAHEKRMVEELKLKEQ